MEEHYIIVVYNRQHERLQESLPFSDYPPKTSIDFGLNFPKVAYATVEKRYGKGELHENA